MEITALLATGLLLAGSSAAGAASAFMEIDGRTTPPVGHYEMCTHLPEECRLESEPGEPIELTREIWRIATSINSEVQAELRSASDMEMWGVEERWSYPVNGMGDTEDYALEKRRRLMAAGIPARSLLLTVVRFRGYSDGHALLTLHTDLGDFVLDDAEERILAWSDTEYEFLKRQSETHSGVWLGVIDDRHALSDQDEQ